VVLAVLATFGDLFASGGGVGRVFQCIGTHFDSAIAALGALLGPGEPIFVTIQGVGVTAGTTPDIIINGFNKFLNLLPGVQINIIGPLIQSDHIGLAIRAFSFTIAQIAL
jgi:hypothetical protein